MKRSFAVAIAFLAVSLAVAAGPASARRSHAAPTTVTVVMRDPGCHWFAVHGAYKRTLTAKGPVSLANYDMAALEITGGRSGMVKADVGHKVTLSRGVYRIVMVGQARDDNILKLVVR